MSDIKLFQINGEIVSAIAERSRDLIKLYESKVKKVIERIWEG